MGLNSVGIIDRFTTSVNNRKEEEAAQPTHTDYINDPTLGESKLTQLGINTGTSDKQPSQVSRNNLPPDHRSLAPTGSLCVPAMDRVADADGSTGNKVPVPPKVNGGAISAGKSINATDSDAFGYDKNHLHRKLRHPSRGVPPTLPRN